MHAVIAFAGSIANSPPRLTACASILAMATITIRNIDAATKRKLQLRAVLNGHSMEAEIREILTATAGQKMRSTSAVKTALGQLLPRPKPAHKKAKPAAKKKVVVKAKPKRR